MPPSTVVNADASNPTPPAPEPVAPPPADDILPAPAPETPPAPPPRPLVWPEWFRPFDLALAIFAVVLAFLMASFVARNADLWRHLAAGRMVTQFQYPWGGDPFTFTAADRAWVNANWLGEVLLYLLHSVDGSGAVAVGVKAIAFAAAIGLLFLLKKPGAPLWPWAVVAVAGAVAAGGFTHLRPQTFALPILSGILAVLYTGDWAKGNKWRMPAILGGMTAAWANIDSFAFLSPLLIGLVLLGEWLHPKVFPSKTDLPSEDDPFRAAPPRDALLRALLLCAVAVLLNPSFIGAVFRNPIEAVVQLVPFELDWQAAEDLKLDGDLKRYSYSALNTEYTSNTILGGNPCGWFAVALWVLGAVAAGVGFRHGRLSHLLAWAVFTLLGAVVHARFVPYGVLLGVPFLAAHLNGFGRMVPPFDKLSQQVGQLVLSGCRAGRVLSLVGVLVLLAASIPGWLQPWNGTVAGRRYVAWAITPDEGMVRSAKVFAGWRADDNRVKVKLLVSPPGGGPAVETESESSRSEVLGSTHGLNTHPDLGDYLAYFAPAEKSFVTSRYRLHRTELKDVVEVRTQMLKKWPTPQEQRASALEKRAPVDSGWLLPIVDKHGIGYLCVAQSEAQFNEEVFLNTRLGFGVTEDDEQRLFAPPWHLDGRLLVVGRTFSLSPQEWEDIVGKRRTGVERAELEKKVDQLRGFARNNRVMTWDVAKEVFAPRAISPATSQDKGMVSGHPPQLGWEYDLLFQRPPLRPVGLDDARNLSWYADTLYGYREGRNQRRQFEWEQRSRRTAVVQYGLAVFGGTALVSTIQFPPAPPSEMPAEQEFALPFLIARSSRDGLAADPNSAYGYLTLTIAFSKRFMPVTEPPSELFAVTPLPPMGPSEEEMQRITALRRAIARLPLPDKTGSEHMVDAIRTRMMLTTSYLNVGPAMPVIAYQLAGQQVQGVQLAPMRIGYIDAARSVLNDLLQVVQHAPPDKMVEVAYALVPLWQRVLQLCEADFWQEFPRYLSSRRVPQEWWGKFTRPGEFMSVLVDQDYLQKDDWDGWQDKFDPEKPDADQIRHRLERLWKVLDNLVGRRLGRMPREGDRPFEAFLGRVVSGLPETALKMVEEKDADKKLAVGATVADILRLMLWVGRAEDVHGGFDELLKDLDKADLPAKQMALERTKFRVVEFELAKLNGDYAKADGIYTELLTTPVGDPPPLQTMTAIIYPDLWRPVAFPPLTESELKQFAAGESVFRGSGGLTGGLGIAFTERHLDALRTRLMFQAITRYQRGVFALLGGDPARAKEHFEKAGDPQGISRFLPAFPADAPKEVLEALPIQKLGGLPPQMGIAFTQFLPKYLELLKKYETK